MPPKKKEEAPKPPKILGRMGTNLKIGIVGLPNVGKSTFFNVLTKSAIPAENFPFCTIDPNEARVAIPDYRFDMLIKDWKPKSQVGFIMAILGQFFNSSNFRFYCEAGPKSEILTVEKWTKIEISKQVHHVRMNSFLHSS